MPIEQELRNISPCPQTKRRTLLTLWVQRRGSWKVSYSNQAGIRLLYRQHGLQTSHSRMEACFTVSANGCFCDNRLARPAMCGAILSQDQSPASCVSHRSSWRKTGKYFFLSSMPLTLDIHFPKLPPVFSS